MPIYRVKNRDPTPKPLLYEYADRCRRKLPIMIDGCVEKSPLSSHYSELMGCDHCSTADPKKYYRLRCFPQKIIMCATMQLPKRLLYTMRVFLLVCELL